MNVFYFYTDFWLIVSPCMRLAVFSARHSSAFLVLASGLSSSRGSHNRYRCRSSFIIRRRWNNRTGFCPKCSIINRICNNFFSWICRFICI